MQTASRPWSLVPPLFPEMRFSVDMRNALHKVEHCLTSYTTPQSEVLNVQEAVFSTDTSRALALLKTNRLSPMDSTNTGRY